MQCIFSPKDVNELKVAIKNIWDLIPNEICKLTIEHAKKRWELCIKHKGRKFDRELLRIIEMNQEDIKWQIKNNQINGIRISYNDNFVLKLKNKEIKEKENNLKN